MRSRYDGFRPRGARQAAIVCIGMPVIDLSFAGRRSGSRYQDPRQLFSELGGYAANAAITVHRLGGRARVVAPLGGPAGQDLTGDNVVAKLEREAIDVAHVVTCRTGDAILDLLLAMASGPS